jgi:hypothetical protein
MLRTPLTARIRRAPVPHWPGGGGVLSLKSRGPPGVDRCGAQSIHAIEYAAAARELKVAPANLARNEGPLLFASAHAR